MAGLDPAIHATMAFRRRVVMDRRVEPGDDNDGMPDLN
jgi:hypothetical protein